MQLSLTLRTPLDQYVDDYFASKVKDLVRSFNLSEREVKYVLEFGVREIKRAPSRRSSSQDSEPSLLLPGKLVLEKTDAKETKTDAKETKTAAVEKCVHPIKGVNPRICDRGAKRTFGDKWYCKTHLKIYTKKSNPKVKKITEKSIAKKVWQKKTLEKKFNFVEEDGYYVDTHTRICMSPNSKEAFGILPKDGGDIQPLQDEHLELLTASNFKYRETSSHLDNTLSESDDGELILLPSDDSD